MSVSLMLVRAAVVVGIVAMVCASADARPKAKKRRGTFAAYIEASAPDDPPRPPTKARPKALPKQAQTNLAVVFVVERSTYELEAAKDVVRRGVAQLTANDVTAVIAFDSEAHICVRPTRASDQIRIDNDISRIQRSQGTSLFVGLKEGFDQLRGMAAPKKLMVVVTDGDGPRDGIDDLLDEIHASRIEVIAIGTKRADKNLLALMADNTEGRMYRLDDPPRLAADFERIRLEPVRVEPEPTSLSIVVLIDRSAASAGAKLDAAKQLIAAIDSTTWGDDLVAVLAFHKSVDYVLKPTWAGDSRIRKAAKKLKAAAGPPDLANALVETREYIERAPNRKLIVLVTDGAKTGAAIDEAIRALRTSNIEVLVVGTPDADLAALQQLARDMGARGSFRLGPAEEPIGIAQWVNDIHYGRPAKRANAGSTTGSAPSASPPPP